MVIIVFEGRTLQTCAQFLFLCSSIGNQSLLANYRWRGKTLGHSDGFLWLLLISKFGPFCGASFTVSLKYSLDDLRKSVIYLYRLSNTLKRIERVDREGTDFGGCFS